MTREQTHHSPTPISAEEPEAVSAFPADPGRDLPGTMTGTPLENKVADTASILEFVLGERISATDDLLAVRALLQRVSLRRRKEDVLLDLPPKITEDEYIELGPRQRAEYDAAEGAAQRELANASDDRAFKMAAQRRLGDLLLLCNGSTTPLYESLKLDRLIEQIEEHSPGSAAASPVRLTW